MADHVEMCSVRSDSPSSMLVSSATSHSSGAHVKKTLTPNYTAVSQDEENQTQDSTGPKTAQRKEVRQRPAITKGHCTKHLKIPSRYLIWLPEILSLALAFLTLMAIVVLLSTRRDKPLPNWPSALQVNSLVAILSSVFKVALLFPATEGISELKWVWYANPRPVTDFDRFDAAGRGPWGSFKLLLRYPRGSLAPFGAAIIVIALAIDPFTQQVVQFYSCPTPSHGLIAKIPRTGNYTSWLPGMPRDSDSADTYVTDIKMLGAIYQGLLKPPTNATANIFPSCPSGNCTFARIDGSVYSSLAICANINNITSTVTDCAACFNGTDCADYSCDYKLPSGLRASSINMMAFAVRPNESEASDWTGIIAEPSTTLLQSKQPLTSSIYRPLATIEILSINCYSSNDNDPTAENEIDGYVYMPSAVSVELSPCIQQFDNVSISGNIWQQGLKSATVIPGDQYWGYTLAGNISSIPGVDCFPSMYPAHGKGLPVVTYNLDTASSVPKTVQCTGDNCFVSQSDTEDDGQTQFYNPACVFSFSGLASMGLFESFQQLFGSLDAPKSITLPGAIQYGSRIVGDAWLQVFWNDGQMNMSSVKSVVNGLVQSINAEIVNGGDPYNSDPVIGAVFGNKTCIGISWPWLTLPVSLFALSCAFLGFTIFASHQSTHIGGSEAGRGPWKSSSSPLLWCGVQDATRERHGSVDAVQEMREQGDRTYVSLSRYDEVTNAIGRWVLKEHTMSPTKP